MSKDNLEFQIKKQIEEREIAPSRDLWSEIQISNTQDLPVKSKFNWYLIAACMVLTISLGAVLFFTGEKTEVKPQIVNNTDDSAMEENIIQSKKEFPIVQNQRNQEERNGHSLSEKKENKDFPIVVAEKKNTPAHQEATVEILPEISQSQPVKMIASMDSAKVPAKKKKYVDPSTLLFSVEHKELIEKTKEGSNVATINLNIK